VLVPLSVTFQGGKPDMANDTELTAWIEEAANSIDANHRLMLYKKAYTRITERAYMAPLTTDVVTYAMHRDLEFTPSLDEVGKFYGARWKK
jgi:peptide/nickel transport system substrate-binding protein